MKKGTAKTKAAEPSTCEKKKLGRRPHMSSYGNSFFAQVEVSYAQEDQGQTPLLLQDRNLKKNPANWVGIKKLSKKRSRSKKQSSTGSTHYVAPGDLSRPSGDQRITLHSLLKGRKLSESTPRSRGRKLKITEKPKLEGSSFSP